MKVLFLTNIPNPYKLKFFDLLGENVELTVLFEMEHASYRDRSWKFDKEHNFEKHVLTPVLKRGDTVFCPNVKKYLRKTKYDYIVIGGYSTLTQIYSILYLSRKKIPFILSVDGGMLGESEAAWKRKLKTHLISKAQFYMSSAKITDEQLEYYGADKDKIFRYPFTSLLEADIFADVCEDMERQKFRDALGVKEKYMIISVGRFSYLNGYGKGYDVLLRAAKQLPSSIGWYIVGGKPTEEFVCMTKEMQLSNIHYIDFKKKEELQTYYRAADLFVLMTISDVWGLVVNEAMACGLPIITTDKCVAGRELVYNGENGYIVKVGDENMLVGKVNAILGDRSKKNMARKSIEIIKQYTIENMTRTYLNFFNLLQGGENGSKN